MGNRESTRSSPPAYKAATDGGDSSPDSTIASQQQEPLTKVTTAGMRALSGPDRELFELAKAGDHEAIRAKLSIKQLTGEPHGASGGGAKFERKPAVMTLFVKDQEMKTMLHHAATAADPESAKATVELILEHTRHSHGAQTLFDLDYINFQDSDGNAAIHCAARHFNTGAIEAILRTGCDVASTNRNGVSGMALICASSPQVLQKIYDESVNLEPGFDPTNQNSKISVDFAGVVGISQDLGRLEMESDLLYNALDNPLKRRKFLLKHPVIQLFLNRKWKKLQWAVYIAVFLRVLWHLIYVGFALSLFLDQCPITIPDEGTDPYHNPAKHASYKPCEADDLNRGLSVFVLIGTAVVFVVELLEFASQLNHQSYRSIEKYATNVRNWLQFAQILIIVSVCVSVWMHGKVYPWMYHFTVVGLILSGILIIVQAGNIPSFAPLIHELYRVASRAFWVVIVFSPIIIGFGLAFVVMSAGGIPQFHGVFVGLTKVFAMATGDIAYDLTMQTKIATFYPVLFRVIYCFFIVFCVLSLYNYIVSYSVSTIHEMFETAEIDKAANLLEHIHLTESLLYSLYGKRSWLPGIQSVFQAQLVLDHKHCVQFHIRDLPDRLRESLIDLGRQNAQNAASNLKTSALKLEAV